PGGVDDAIDAEVAFARRARSNRNRLVGETHVQRGAIALGIDGDRGNAHLPARTDDSNGDFAPVRDENFVQSFLFYRTEPRWAEQAPPHSSVPTGEVDAGGASPARRRRQGG